MGQNCDLQDLLALEDPSLYSPYVEISLAGTTRAETSCTSLSFFCRALVWCGLCLFTS